VLVNRPWSRHFIPIHAHTNLQSTGAHAVIIVTRMELRPAPQFNEELGMEDAHAWVHVYGVLYRVYPQGLLAVKDCESKGQTMGSQIRYWPILASSTCGYPTFQSRDFVCCDDECKGGNCFARPTEKPVLVYGSWALDGPGLVYVEPSRNEVLVPRCMVSGDTLDYTGIYVSVYVQMECIESEEFV